MQKTNQLPRRPSAQRQHPSNSLRMVADGVHALFDGELGGRHVLVVDQREEERLVRVDVAPLAAALHPRHVAEAATQLPVLTLRRRGNGVI